MHHICSFASLLNATRNLCGLIFRTPHENKIAATTTTTSIPKIRIIEIMVLSSSYLFFFFNFFFSFYNRCEFSVDSLAPLVFFSFVFLFICFGHQTKQTHIRMGYGCILRSVYPHFFGHIVIFLPWLAVLFFLCIFFFCCCR